MTYKDIRAEASASREKRQHMYARGGGVSEDAKADKPEIAGAVHKHESHLHKGEPKTKLKHGGMVEGRARGGAMDRPGAKKGGKTVINIVMPQTGGDKAMPVPMAAAAPRPPMPSPSGAPMPPRPPMPPPQGGMAPMAPPGGGMPPRAKGGRMTAGAGSGEGRLEKAEGKK